MSCLCHQSEKSSIPVRSPGFSWQNEVQPRMHTNNHESRHQPKRRDEDWAASDRAKRMECGRLADAFEPGARPVLDSARKPAALHTLRAEFRKLPAISIVVVRINTNGT